MLGRKTVEERDAQVLGAMLHGSTKWYRRVLLNVFALLVCGFCFCMFFANAELDTAWMLYGCGGLICYSMFGMTKLFMHCFDPLLREVGRLRGEVERLKAGGGSE